MYGFQIPEIPKKLKNFTYLCLQSGRGFEIEYETKLYSCFQTLYYDNGLFKKVQS